MDKEYCCINCVYSEENSGGMCYCELKQNFVEIDDVCEEGAW